jgi:uncharacterized coiled-coil protein SlyX
MNEVIIKESNKLFFFIESVKVENEILNIERKYLKEDNHNLSQQIAKSKKTLNNLNKSIVKLAMTKEQLEYKLSKLIEELKTNNK